MKKTLLIMVMALAVLLTQCRKPEVKFPSPVAPEGTTVSMTVTAGPGSKTDITAEGAITWSEGDKLYVGYDSKYIGCLEIKSGVGTPTGWFSGDVTLTGISEGTEKEFHFFYLGSNPPAVTSDASSVEVSFAEQEIYAEDGKLENASKHHVGYGSAKGTVAGSEVTGINVTLVSKVALARFSFTDGTTPYSGALTLSGDHIYNSMTVGFGGTFSGTKTGGGEISLTDATLSEKYVMLVPTGGTGGVALSFGGDGKTGGATIEGGIQSNKFYGKTGAIPVNLKAPTPTPTHGYVDLGLPSGRLWATCNLGASKPEEYGDYYAWGEILPYYADGHSLDNPCSTWRIMTTGAGNTNISNGYTWKTYVQGGWDYFVEWYAKPYGDDKILTSDYDAAHAKWGELWRMPTEADFSELLGNTTRTWKDADEEITIDGKPVSMQAAGYYCIGTKDGYTDKYIFLPAAGNRSDVRFFWAGTDGQYWSSSLDQSDEWIPAYGLRLSFDEFGESVGKQTRSEGISVRPVW